MCLSDEGGTQARDRPLTYILLTVLFTANYCGNAAYLDIHFQQLLQPHTAPIVIILEYKREVSDFGLLPSNALRSIFCNKSWAACGCQMTSRVSSAEQRTT